MAARALGRPEPEEIREEVTSSGVLHAERVTAPRGSAEPKGLSTAEWYALRAQGGPEPEPESVAEEVVEVRPLPGWARRMVYRPGGGDAA